ncbi:MAG: hypothetical protein ACFFCW_36320 [Candidatus Hodarchaeota archaeon]
MAEKGFLDCLTTTFLTGYDPYPDQDNIADEYDGWHSMAWAIHDFYLDRGGAFTDYIPSDYNWFTMYPYDQWRY